MFERFTDSARSMVTSARACARAFAHSGVGAEHLLLGALEDDQGIPAEVLRGLGVERSAVMAQVESFGSFDTEALRTVGIDLEHVRQQVEEAFGPGALNRTRRQRQGLFGHRSTRRGGLPFSAEAKQALAQSLHEAAAAGDRSIGTQHLLLGLLASEEGTVMAILRRLGVSADRDFVRGRVLERLRRTA
jgi:ATP-dependent Clp protease ATP-binding subunit ClpA